MTHVEILKAARRLIKASMKGTGKFHRQFICCAIEDVTRHTDYDKGQQLTDWIGEMIHPHYTLGQWLLHRMDLDIDIDLDIALVNKHRLLWLDKLIKEYEQ